MNSDKILYYPYINIPNTLWTSRALLYWDNVGVIVPEEYIYNPENLNGFMRDLVTANLVDQIIPRNFTEDLPKFKDGFLEIILSSQFNINRKRRNFRNRKHFKLHVEKFDNGIMEVLRELGLARMDDWPWWIVEEETARMLMTYLASVISIIDNRNPMTDSIVEIGNHRSFSTPKNSTKYEEIRERLLNDILPLPTEIRTRDLVRIKEDYQPELRRFRIQVEKLITTLSQFKNPSDLERQFELEIKEIKESKEFVLAKLKERNMGKLVFGTLSTLAATGISVAQTPKELFYWTIPSIINTVWSAVENHRKEEISRSEPFSYLALVENKIGSPNISLPNIGMTAEIDWN